MHDRGKKEEENGDPYYIGLAKLTKADIKVKTLKITNITHNNTVNVNFLIS